MQVTPSNQPALAGLVAGRWHQMHSRTVTYLGE
jgi:hypothetical protein